MEISGSKIECLFQEKLLLYRDLLEVLKQERKRILDTDVDSLWEISRKKQEIAGKIEGLRREVLAILTEASIDHDMDGSSFQVPKILSLVPEKIGLGLKNLNLSLTAIKGEINNRVKENKRLVEECLDMLDELIGIIANAGRAESVYDKGRPPANTKTNLLLHKEV
jgi:flagellar biosynthesis/type III secretory pathway chaperone